MTPEQYNSFTEQLRMNCEQDGRILGLVAAGSMAQQDYQPDQWSDHDFFLIVQPNEQAAVKADLSWLPNHEQIVYHFPDSAHGMRALYADYHLVELAVFDAEELNMAKANRYRVLVDKANVTEQMAAVAAETAAFVTSTINPEQALGHFLGNLWVGYGRYQRGEHLSAHEFVKNHSLINLLKLLQQFVPSEQHALLDNLNPTRRFERCYPQLGARLNQAINVPTPETCRQLLAIAETELANRIPDFPQTAVNLLKSYFK